jgi:catechol 2,3-dioxygenase-like lactoylglutathione lyase family enzyme
MIGYVMVGTNNLARAAVFYDAIAGALGVGRMMEFPKSIAWGVPGGAAGIAITLPYDGKPASVGNGTMVAFEAKNEAQVQQVHAVAMAQGAQCEGPPGPRGDGFYAGYFRDLDGNKLCAFVISAPA